MKTPRPNHHATQYEASAKKEAKAATNAKPTKGTAKPTGKKLATA